MKMGARGSTILLVKDLIQTTIWKPAANYENKAPKISVLLPTYSRAQSGLFHKAVTSILEQSFGDFELIIVDDGSTDGTKELIEQFADQDERISCLTHPQNIGLPAVSEYEAFMKSKGEYLIFAFDDFVFETNAFEALYHAAVESGHAFCHGLANLYYIKGTNKPEQAYLIFGKDNTRNLEITNTIANAAVIIKKEVFYQVGLYDPHILLSRSCDWDLWRRISKHYYMHKIDALIGSEYGCTTNDSLGVTYHHPLWIVCRYLAINRNQQLLPQVYEQLNVLSSIEQLDAKSNFYIHELSKFYANKTWYKNAYLNTMPFRPFAKKIVFYCIDLFNYYHFFYGLEQSNFAVIPMLVGPKEIFYDDLYYLVDADIVIFDRMDERYLPIIQFLKHLNVPCYQFADDKLQQSKKIDNQINSHDKNFTNRIDGIITSNEALKNLYLQKQIHTNVLLFAKTLDNNLIYTSPKLEKTPGKGVHIAILCEQFSSESLEQYIIPALNQVHQSTPVTLYIANNICLPSANIIKFTISAFEFKENHTQFIHNLRNMQIDIVIHSTSLNTAAPYKKDFILLTAFYIQANIIVLDERSFEGFGLEQGIIKTEHNVAEIVTSIFQAGIDFETAKAIHRKLYAFCSEQFGPNTNVSLLENIIQRHKELNYLHLEDRLRMLHHYLSVSQIWMKSSSKINIDPLSMERSKFQRLITYYQMFGFIITYKKIFQKILLKLKNDVL